MSFYRSSLPLTVGPSSGRLSEIFGEARPFGLQGRTSLVSHHPQQIRPAEVRYSVQQQQRMGAMTSISRQHSALLTADGISSHRLGDRANTHIATNLPSGTLRLYEPRYFFQDADQGQVVPVIRAEIPGLPQRGPREVNSISSSRARVSQALAREPLIKLAARNQLQRQKNNRMQSAFTHTSLEPRARHAYSRNVGHRSHSNPGRGTMSTNRAPQAVVAGHGMRPNFLNLVKNHGQRGREAASNNTLASTYIGPNDAVAKRILATGGWATTEDLRYWKSLGKSSRTPLNSPVLARRFNAQREKEQLEHVCAKNSEFEL